MTCGDILDNQLSIHQPIGQFFINLFDSWQQLVLAFILSCITSATLSSPTFQLAPLQCDLNATAWFVANLPASAHITDIIGSLHWLLVTHCWSLKLCLMMYHVDNSISPPTLWTKLPESGWFPVTVESDMQSQASSRYLASGLNLGWELSLWQEHTNGTLCQNDPSLINLTARAYKKYASALMLIHCYYHHHLSCSLLATLKITCFIFTVYGSK